MKRWTKYTKTGFYIEKQEIEKESSKTQAAHVSWMTTSIALKCLPSKELLDYLEKGIQKLDLEVDILRSKLDEKSKEDL